MKKPALYVILGIALIVFGLYFGGWLGNGGVSAQDQARCEQIVNKIYGDSAEAKQSLLPKCNEAGMVAMMDAKDQNLGAKEAAQNVGQANQKNVFSVIIACALIGAGIGALGAAATANKKKH